MSWTKAFYASLRCSFILNAQMLLSRVRTEEIIAAVSARVNDDHQLSICRLSRQLGLCYSTTRLERRLCSTKRCHMPHYIRVTMFLSRGEFGEYFISYSVPFNWPPRSCDLMPLDYFLYGYVKSHVYTDKPTLKHLFVRYIHNWPLQPISQIY